jgi:hypothetical protein
MAEQGSHIPTEVSIYYLRFDGKRLQARRERSASASSLGPKWFEASTQKKVLLRTRLVRSPRAFLHYLVHYFVVRGTTTASDAVFIRFAIAFVVRVLGRLVKNNSLKTPLEVRML